jgi:endonuclease YncB( thermonuclease family)
MLRVCITMLLAALFAPPAHAQVLIGPVEVIDGDSLEMTGTRIRLFGMDAPEGRQTCTRNDGVWACGAEAKATLAAIIDSQPLTCTSMGRDVYGRTLAQCRTRAGDIGREMVRRGMAIALDNAPADYQEAAAVAQRMKFGMWSGDFQSHAEWRSANPQAAPRLARLDRAAAPQPARLQPASDRRYTNAQGCAIKGNHSRHGDWIYHMPGQKYYAQTRPEALFCTEREAQAAGYRRSKQ